MFTPSTQMMPLDADSPLFEGTRISYGLAPVLSQLYKWSLLRNHPQWDLYLVNVMTLLRNCITSTPQGDHELFPQVQSDIDILIRYLSSYTAIDRTDVPHPQLVLYIPDYQYLPETYLRPPNKQMSQFHEVYTRFLRVAPRLFEKRDITYDDFPIHVCFVGTRQLTPHLDLVRQLEQVRSTYRYDRVCMLSHIPIDYHVYRYMPKFQLIRSYTGDVIEKKDFGTRILKKEEIPFNAYTHLLFGDEKFLKSPLGRKEKHLLIEEASRRRWKYLPDTAIMTAITQMKLVEASYFTGIKL